MSGDALIRIEYGLQRRPWADPDLDQLDVWEASLDVGTFASGDDDGVDEGGVAWTTVGRATLIGLDPHRHVLLGQRPFEVADAHSADTAFYYEHVFDVDGEYLADVREQFEFLAGPALFLHDVKVPSNQRRSGYASLLAADAILTLAAHGTAVIAHPGVTDLDPDDADDADRRLRDETRNTRFLAALGFVPFRDQLWTLDLSAGHGTDVLAAIRRRDRT